MLDKIADHLLKKALGDNPRVVEEATRRIEAGEDVTFEELQAGEQEPGK